MMLIDFLSVEMGDKTVHNLIEALKAINRHDVVKMITAVYSGMFKQCPFFYAGIRILSILHSR